MNLIPSMKIISLTKSGLPEDLNVVEHGLDDLFSSLQLSLDLIAIVLGVLRMKMINPFGFIFDPGLNIVQFRVSHFGLLMDFLSEALQLFKPEKRKNID